MMSCHSVNSLMFKDVIHGEDSPTCIAFKSHWSGMGFLMLLEVRVFAERLPKFIELKRPLSSVHLAMIEKTGFWPE